MPFQFILGELRAKVCQYVYVYIYKPIILSPVRRALQTQAPVRISNQMPEPPQVASFKAVSLYPELPHPLSHYPELVAVGKG